ncbi:MAG: hypothetical protein QXQ94_02495 [Candidatus Bathyarchaeia archaeon]
MRKKVRIHYKYCRIAGFLTVLCFILAILCCYQPKLLPLLAFSIIDLILTSISAYYITIEEVPS